MRRAAEAGNSDRRFDRRVRSERAKLDFMAGTFIEILNVKGPSVAVDKEHKDRNATSCCPPPHRNAAGRQPGRQARTRTPNRRTRGAAGAVHPSPTDGSGGPENWRASSSARARGRSVRRGAWAAPISPTARPGSARMTRPSMRWTAAPLSASRHRSRRRVSDPSCRRASWRRTIASRHECRCLPSGDSSRLDSPRGGTAATWHGAVAGEVGRTPGIGTGADTGAVLACLAARVSYRRPPLGIEPRDSACLSQRRRDGGGLGAGGR